MLKISMILLFTVLSAFYYYQLFKSQNNFPGIFILKFPTDHKLNYYRSCIDETKLILFFVFYEIIIFFRSLNKLDK